MVSSPPKLLALVAAVVIGVVTGAAPSAHGLPDAFFHTQSNGNRGVDVLALQHLLQHHQQPAQPTAVFDETTAAALSSFQTAAGLPATGIADPATWAELVPTLRDGTGALRAGVSGPGVMALQEQLNAKRRLSLPVDGEYSAEVVAAVRAFQSHAGIAVDGIAGPVTWRNLIWHYDYPGFEHMCDQDPDDNGTANWGTGAATGQLEAAVRAFGETGQGKVPLGDIGFEHGGPIPGHSSHQVGLDVDLWPIRTDSAQCTAGRITWRSPEYDREDTRRLVKAIYDAAPGKIRLILFNDPVLIEEGLTTEYDNHDNHLHVRYCESSHPNSSYRCGTPGIGGAP